MKRFLLAVLLAGCVRGEHRDARDKYNEGVNQLVAGNFESAEKALLDARSAAGVDPTLRFRAAYDLGMAYAAHAEQVKGGKDADLAKALELAQQAKSWFGDAQRLRPADADTKTNLAIVTARVQAMSDELRKGEGKLEARLDALIAQQRRVLDGARGAWAAIKEAGGADPLAQQSALVHLADEERGIVAEAGVIGDLAADEIDAIGKKAEDKRSDEEKARIVQLKNLDLYLIEGRTGIANARRKLQELSAEDGVGSAESALAALKRAREQLLDPITVLRGVAQDQVQIVEETSSTSTAAWLAPQQIAERQGGLRDRVEEVRARLSAGAEPAKDAKPDPQRDKLMARVKAALPAIEAASIAMDAARTALGAKQTKPALEQENVALEQLAKAIEEFADLKQTTELAYAEQQQIDALLAGGDDVKDVPVAERAKRTHEGLARNVARVERLAGLISDQAADEQAKLAQQKDADPKQAEQSKALYAKAESLRAEAQTALAALDKAIAANKDPLTPGKDAEAKLGELRQLFFSVIEHLQQLVRDQGETRDQTSASAGLDDLSRAPKLPGIITREEQHAQMADAIHDALAKQADAAGKQGPDPTKQNGPDPKALAAAAQEVQLGKSDMTDADNTLKKARDATSSSESLAPAVKSEGSAIEHLEQALKLLQPPPKKNDQDQKQDQQKQDQQQQDQQQQQQQQQGGASQRARDDDARKQRERHEKAAPSSDPVDKDW